MNKKNQKATTLEQWNYFPSSVYSIDRPDFIDIVNLVSEENLEKARQEKNLDELYPSYMSYGFADDERLKEFQDFIGQTAWNILDEQGYDMNNLVTYFTEMWTQEHHKHSGMEQHVHSGGSQIVGFYFLECPEDCSKLIFHDPRNGKAQINLPQKEVKNVTYASELINFLPRAGQLIFTNAWIPHSFTQHNNKKPIKFVHFTLGAYRIDTLNKPEII